MSGIDMKKDPCPARPGLVRAVSMGRRLLNVLALLSLPLLAGAGALWVRSYRCTDRVFRVGDGGARSVRTARGHVEVGLYLSDAPSPPAQRHGLRYVRDIPQPPYNWLIDLDSEAGDRDAAVRVAGFAWYSKRNARRGLASILIVVPFWALSGAASVPLLIWVGARVRGNRDDRRRRLGRCAACGYDLRVTPDRCPECGTVALGFQLKESAR